MLQLHISHIKHDDWQLWESSIKNPLAHPEGAKGKHPTRARSKLEVYQTDISAPCVQSETVFTEIHKVPEKWMGMERGDCLSFEILMWSRWDISTPFFGGVIQSDSLWGRQIRSDGCSDTDIQRGKIKRERERETDLEVPELLPSSSGAVQPSFGVAQGREEVEPCSRNQMGTFLEHNRQTYRLKRWRFKVIGGYGLCRQLVTQQRQKKWDKQGKKNRRLKGRKQPQQYLCLKSFHLCAMRTFEKTNMSTPYTHAGKHD